MFFEIDQQIKDEITDFELSDLIDRNKLFEKNKVPPGSASHPFNVSGSISFSEINQMKCKDLQFDLAVYFDDVLPPEAVASVDAHLAECPLCRQQLGEMRVNRTDLRALTRPAIPAARLASIRNAVAAFALPQQHSPSFRMVESRGNWIDVWLMPYAVGACASVILGISLLWLILNPLDRPQMIAEAANPVSSPAGAWVPADGFDITPLQYASTRLAISDESPSVNPQGALVALTRSLMRGEMKDEEVVVVADVFGDGLARIAEVVEPSGDERTVRQLQQALQSDPAFAPFVPANMDHRAESIRVVLRVQTVAVSADPEGPVR